MTDQPTESDDELNARFPGRELRKPVTADEFRAAWPPVMNAWAAAVDRASSMPSGTVDIRVNDEWSFAQTVRHLVLATNAWLNGAILGEAQPFHPIGQPFSEYESDGYDMSIFVTTPPSWDEILEVRAAHQAMVTDFLASVTDDELAAPRPNPWSEQHPVTVARSLRVILNEEWEHLRFALRDLDIIAAR